MADYRGKPCLDCWEWQRTAIRCGLRHDEPRLIDWHFATGVDLVAHGLLNPWRMGFGSLNLLLDTASDTMLPWHWRSLCLDNVYRPLQLLHDLPKNCARRRSLEKVCGRLLALRLQPSLTPGELAEGNPYA